MSFILGIVFIIVGLVISVALHEAGHLIPAKLFGCRVSQYMVGFGPTLWSRKFGNTEYGIKAILLGGYCRILGMYGPARPGAKVYRRGFKFYTQAEYEALPEAEREKLKPTMAEEARQAELEVLYAEKADSEAFYRLSMVPKLIVMLGGITMNLILGFLFLAISLAGIGVMAPSTTIADTVCYQQQKPVLCTQVKAGETVQESPAKQAGMLPGDKIVKVNGLATASWDEVRSAIKAAGSPVKITISRGGKEQQLSVAVAEHSIGVVSEMELQTADFGTVAKQYGGIVTGTGNLILHLPQAIWSTVSTTVQGEARPANSVMSVVGIGRVAGEISAAPSDKVSVGQKIAALLSILASLNVALALFNLIPLPPLDGGHVIVALWQGIRRLMAKLRGAPDPGWTDASGLVGLTYVIAVLLIALTVLLFAADIFNPVKIFGR